MSEHDWMSGMDGAFDSFAYKCAACGLEIDDRESRPEYGCPGRKPRPEFVCAWCGARTIEPISVINAKTVGLFCSHRCIDKAEESSRCSTPNCAVCSGAMRERAGRGDSNG